MDLLLEQIKTVAAERDILLVSAAEDTVPAPAKVLLSLKGIGPDFASVLWQEGLFRHFDNRRQVAAYAGLAPTPWQSGSVDREQGVSKAGNPRLRTTMLQLAWLWLRHQPDSALSRWFHQRAGMNGHFRKTMITALAQRGADGTEDIGGSGALIGGRGWPGSTPGPATRDLVLLTDPGFIGEPDLYRGRLDTLVLRDLCQDGRETFLKCSIAPAAWA